MRNPLQMDFAIHGQHMLPLLEHASQLSWLFQGSAVPGDGGTTFTNPLTTHEPFPDHTFRESLEYSLYIVATHIHWILLGVIIGMLIGTIPGMGGVVALTIILPFTFHMNQNQAFTLMAAAVGATTFSGSVTAILINTPGTASNAATLIDGYPMTQKGESATAIGASALSSASGAVLSAIVFIALIPVMINFVLLFGPSEIFWIVLFAIVLIPLFVANNPLYGILTALLGAMVAFIGIAPQSAEPRFTFGFLYLQDGVTLIAMLIGFFAIAEIVRVASLERNTIVDFERVQLTGSKMAGIRAVFKYKWLWFRCSLIGLVVGAIPGAGGSAAAFVAYAHAIQSSDDRDAFGRGAIEGVIGPESANDAKDGGQLFPTLGLGIPGSGSMAVFLGAMLVHGVFPGPRVLDAWTELVLIIALSLLISNVLTSVIGLILAEKLTLILKIPIPLLMTFIAILAFAAVYMVRTTLLDLVLVMIFAAFGLVLIYLQISRIPFLIAFILAAILEHNFWLAVRFGHGRIFEVFFTGTLNIILITIFALSIIFLLFPVKEILHERI